MLLDPGTCAPCAAAFSAGTGRPHQSPPPGMLLVGQLSGSTGFSSNVAEKSHRGARWAAEMRCYCRPHPTRPQLQSLGGDQFWPPVSILLPLLFRQEYLWRLPGVSSEIF